MKKAEKLSKEFHERLVEWEKSQEGQTNGYEYERSFVEMMRQLTKDAFEEMAGTQMANKNKKKRL